MYKKDQRIHFIGIGGIGMSGIAEVLLNLEYRVSGTDLQKTEITERLVRLGGKIEYGHKAAHVEGANVVVISSAVKRDNPEVLAARAKKIPVIPRAEMLAELMRMKYGVVVAGTHGKTTTTSLIGTVLAEAEMDPTIVVGGKVWGLGTNAKLGQGEFLVAEADESDGSFLTLSPTIAVVTNIDPEHLDHYGSMERLTEAFLNFLNKVPFYGADIICLDHPVLQAMIPQLQKRFITYGFSKQADFQAKDIRFDKGTSSFTVIGPSDHLGHLTVRLPGHHNVYNCLATIAVGCELEIEISTILDALAEFGGIQRRFEVKGEWNGVLVVDDYGHHPEEIKATLSAARLGWDRRIVVAFQPHRFSRTKDLFQHFLGAFNQADHLVVTSIYPAGENPIPGIDAKNLAEEIAMHGHKSVTFIKDQRRIAGHLKKELRPGDLFITLGAGDIWKVGEKVIEGLKAIDN